MKAISERTAVVLAGSFNPAIFTPQWVAVNGFGHPQGEEFKVEIEMQAQVGAVGQHRYTFDGISYTAGFKNIVLHIGDSDVGLAGRIVAGMSAMLGQLPHTPVSGVGFNFAFIVEEPGPLLLNLLTARDEVTETFSNESEVVTRKWGNTIKWGDALVNVDCELAGGQVTIAFNVHHSTVSATAAAAVLCAENAFETHRSHAIAAAIALSGQHLE